MIIKRIELVNYCQHKHKDIAVSGNLIAVVGHNGCGKSNMLGAVQFALTGEQPGKNKADLLHWGAKEGHVVLEFEQDGKPGRIERSINANKVTLEYDGTTTSGITNVAKEMEERLHMDKDLVRQSVFVRQTEVDTIISAKTDKRDREVAFQKLLGIDAAKIHKNLTDWMYAASKPVNYDIQLTEAVQRLGELETRRANLDNEVEAAARDLSEFGEVDESQSANIGKVIALISNVLSAKSAVATCEANEVAKKTAFDNAVSAAGDVGENPGVDIATKSEEIAALRDEIAKCDKYAKAKQSADTAEDFYKKALAAPHPSEEEVAEVVKERDSMKAKLAVIESEIYKQGDVINQLVKGGANCPVCGKPLDAGHLEKLRSEYEKLMDERRDLYGMIKTYNEKASALDNSLSAYKKDVDFREAIHKKFSAEFAAAQQPTLDCQTARDSLEAAQVLWSKQKDYDAKIASHKSAISSAELQLKVAQDALANAKSHLEQTETAAKAVCGEGAADNWEAAKSECEKLVADADRNRAKQTELKMAVTRATSARDEVVKTLETLAKTVETLKQAQAEQDVLAKKLATLEKVRDWFHYANGPRVLVTQVLGALTDDVNRFLGNFTAPFIVIPDNEQVGFKVEFTDGRTRPEEPPGTDVLSGGERVQLAVAFRLAIYCMFAGKLGLLSLDEPTAYLDDGNVDRFGILLSKVRELARNMNTQVFMATHERAVIPHMDSIIDLN